MFDELHVLLKYLPKIQDIYNLKSNCLNTKQRLTFNVDSCKGFQKATVLLRLNQTYTEFYIECVSKITTS